MKLRWQKYFYELWSAILRSIGVQGLSWSGINGLSAAGMDVPALNLKALGWMFLIGAILPAIFKYWEKTPLPEIELEETTVTERHGDNSVTTKTTTLTQPVPEKSNESKTDESQKGFRRD